MGKRSEPPPPPSISTDHLERLTEILDEDHLEFEEILLDLQRRLNNVSAQVNRLSGQVDEIGTALTEMKETSENIEAALNRLLHLVGDPVDSQPADTAG